MNEQAAPRNPLKILGFIILMIPSLIIRIGGAFLRFRSKARRAGRLFNRELRRQGLDETTATRLTEVYSEGTNLFAMIRSLH